MLQIRSMNTFKTRVVIPPLMDIANYKTCKSQVERQYRDLVRRFRTGRRMLLRRPARSFQADSNARLVCLLFRAHTGDIVAN